MGPCMQPARGLRMNDFYGMKVCSFLKLIKCCSDYLSSSDPWPSPQFSLVYRVAWKWESILVHIVSIPLGRVSILEILLLNESIWQVLIVWHLHKYVCTGAGYICMCSELCNLCPAIHTYYILVYPLQNCGNFISFFFAHSSKIKVLNILLYVCGLLYNIHTSFYLRICTHV